MSSLLLSPKQQLTAEIIFKLTQEAHYPPTLDEIASAMGITKGTLQYHIAALRKKHMISWIQGAARSIRIIDDTLYESCKVKYIENMKASGKGKLDLRFLSREPSPVKDIRKAEADIDSAIEFSTTQSQVSAVPILGQIRAGLPLEVTNQAEDYLDMQSFFPSGCYALTVKGQSMMDALINDGDIVLIEPRNVANNGEIVVALINNEASTLKRFYKESNGTIRLQPENPYMKPIYLYPENNDRLDIQGVVKGVVRKI